MTPDDAIDAIAQAIVDNTTHDMTPMEALDLACAAIRALHERGGLVVARMPGPLVREEPLLIPTVEDGWNAALVAVRAAAVEVGVQG